MERTISTKGHLLVLLLACCCCCSTLVSASGVIDATQTPGESDRQAIQANVQAVQQQNAVGAYCTACVAVPTYITVFRRNAGNSEISEDLMEQQMDILNRAFATTPFFFTTESINFVQNQDYYNSFTQQNAPEIGTTYRQGGLEALNIYVGNKNGLESFSNFPPIIPRPSGTILSVAPYDGIFLQIDSLPMRRPGSLGATLVHEAGHFLGLFDTALGESCDASNLGDFVDDTPQQLKSTSGDACPIGRNSCPELGLYDFDPITNFMDNSDEFCLDEFTQGQAERMFLIYNLYRRQEEDCASGYTQLQIELAFVKGARRDGIQWSLEGPGVMVDQASQGHVLSMDGNLDNNAILFDYCLLSNEEFLFTITDSANALDYYRLHMDGKQIQEGSGPETYTLDTSPAAPLVPSFCFSGDMIFQTRDSGRVQVRDLKIGDYVLDGTDGSYSQVYSFGHYHESLQAEFLQLQPMGIELSKDHMIFVDSGGGAVPASMVQVGDELSGETVTSITTVTKEGVYAPFTMSGSLVVNDQKVSSYVSFQGSNVVVLGGVKTPLSYQTAAHCFQSFHRLVARFFGVSENETYTSAGLSRWIAAPHGFMLWLERQHFLLAGLVWFLVTPLLFGLYAIDTVVSCF